FVLERRIFTERNEQKLQIIHQYSTVINDVVERCKTFESYDGTLITVPNVQSWLLQFDVEEIPLAIRILAAVKFWGRAALADALALSVAGRFPQGVQVLALGGP